VSDVAGEVEEHGGDVVAEEGGVGRCKLHGAGRLPQPVLQR